MENTIYVDILILINIFITYCLLMSTKIILGLSVVKWRLILASVLGGLFSLIILIDFNNVILASITKISMATIMVLLCFYQKDVKNNIKNIFVFYIINFVYGGLMFALWYFVTPPTMVYKNNIVYFDISALFLVLSTIASYLIIKLFYWIFSKKGVSTESCTLLVTVGATEVLLKGFLDNGNKLVDAISSLPVIICSYDSIKPLLPKNHHEDILSLSYDKINDSLWKKRLRVVSASTVNKISAMPAFIPDKCRLECAPNINKDVHILISIANTQIMDSQYDAIVNCAIMK